jgi:hypothetical protein
MNCPVWPGSTKEFFVFVCSAVRAEVFSFFLLTLSLSFFFLTLLFISIFVSFSKHVTHISYCQKGQSRDHHLFGQLFPLKSYLTRPVKNILFSLYNSIPAAASLLIYIYQNSTYTFNSNFKYCVVLYIIVSSKAVKLIHVRGNSILMTKGSIKGCQKHTDKGYQMHDNKHFDR